MFNLENLPHIQGDDIVRARDEITAECSELLDRQQGEELGEADAARFDALTGALDELRRKHERHERIRQLGSDPEHVRPGVSYNTDGSDAPGQQHRDQALRNVDAYVRSGAMPASAAEKAEQVVHLRGGAQFLEAASDPVYARAFCKLLSPHGEMMLDAEERAAFQRVEHARAFAVGVPASGGYTVSTIIDPALRVTGDGGSASPIRALAEVRTEVGQSFKPVTSEEVQSAWMTEAEEATDAAPDLDSPEIKAFRATTFVPFSIDWESAMGGGVQQELASLLTDSYDRLTAAAFWSGSGTTAPGGLWTGLDGTASEVAPTTSETWDPDDAVKLQNSLPPRFQPGAVFMASLSTANSLAAAETSAGALRNPGMSATPPTLLRKPFHEWSSIPGIDGINAAETSDNPVLVYGDIHAAFVVVDFMGSTIEVIPNLMGTARQMPTGQRGLVLYARCGAGVVIENAARVLSIPTTA